MADEIDGIVDFENILSSQDKDKLQRALDAIPRMRRNVQKATRAGIDTGDMSTKIDEMEKKINRLIAEL